jgi:atrial natriuretic peptide receptor A
MSLISWHRNESNEIENRKALRAFETVLILAVKEPDTERYRHFSYQVNALQEGINHENVSMGKLVCLMFVNNFNLFHLLIEKVNPYVSTFYDAVLLYAYGLNRTIESNENSSDGFAVVQKMWNVSFEGSNGIVQISETGDRVSDYSLFDLNPKSGQFEVIKYF